MRFEVFRVSDLNEGLATAPEPPCPGAEFDAEEQRWLVDLHTLEDLLKLAEMLEDNVMIVPTGKEDLPILEIQDEEKVNDASEG